MQCAIFLQHDQAAVGEDHGAVAEFGLVPLHLLRLQLEATKRRRRAGIDAAIERANRYGEAASLLAAVHATAEGLGSEPLIRRTDELARVGRGRGTIEEPWRPLTAREFEVARLIARGQTNAEIAAELAIAPKTASAHVEHILAKLGVTRRTEIATWVASITSTNGASTAEPAPVGARR